MNEKVMDNFMKDFSTEIRRKVEASPYIYCIEKTCESFPEQYNAYDKNGFIIAYIRLRSGYLSCKCPNVGGEIVYEKLLYDDGNGYFKNESSRNKYMIDIIKEIDKFYNKNTIRLIDCDDVFNLDGSKKRTEYKYDAGDGGILTMTSEPFNTIIFEKLLKYQEKALLPEMLPGEPAATLDIMLNAYIFLSECRSTTPEALRGARNLISVMCDRLNIKDERVHKFDYHVDSVDLINNKGEIYENK